MSGMVGTILLASLAGSLHCIGMCGGLLAACLGNGGRSSTRGAQLLYHLGRLICYVGLGIAAGLLGAATDLGAQAAGVHRASSFVAAGALVLWAIAPLLSRWLPKPVAGTKSAGLGRRAFARVMATPMRSRAFVLGLLSGLLPCGWLYAFVLAAAGTASAVGGAAIMAAFWLGTVPALLGVGIGGGSLLARLRQRFPKITPALLLLLALTTVLHRGGLAGTLEAPERPSDPTTFEPSCCDGGE